MRAINRLSVYMLPAVASVLLTSVGYANDDPAFFARGGNASTTAHQRVNAPRGALVRYPELHWTSRIATGTEIVFAREGNVHSTVYNGVYGPGKVVGYPRAHWAAAIGTGTAAALER